MAFGFPRSAVLQEKWREAMPPDGSPPDILVTHTPQMDVLDTGIKGDEQLRNVFFKHKATR